jgi:CRISPR-associated protein Cmr6
MPPQKPSIWLKHPFLTSNPDREKIASFVEYLRWMRKYTGDKTIDSGTKIALFKEFEKNDFSETLNRLTERTKNLADEFFEVTCHWRIRVGGTEGVESMLLPAFDNLGMPYIPSITLRGVAREMAEQDETTKDSDIKEIFGDINSQPTKMGKVVFLDAYPLSYVNGKDKNKLGGISPDMANAIWTWNGDLTPEYNRPMRQSSDRKLV